LMADLSTQKGHKWPKAGTLRVCVKIELKEDF